MEHTLNIINLMQQEGLFTTHAIGGGIAALFYVVGAEYLIAIMLQTHRGKDQDRLVKFMDEADISRPVLNAILEQHQLKDKFNRFMRQYYGAER